MLILQFGDQHICFLLQLRPPLFRIDHSLMAKKNFNLCLKTANLYMEV